MVLFVAAGWLLAMVLVLSLEKQNNLELAPIDLGGSTSDLSPAAASAPVGQLVSQTPVDMPARQENTTAQVVTPVAELPIITALEFRTC